MIKAPSCLHIPVFYEDDTALISWQGVEEAVSYQVECVFDESFEQGALGRSWTALDAPEQTWGQIEVSGLSWARMEQLPAQGVTWQNIELAAQSWERAELQGLTWAGIAMLPVCFTVFDGMGEPYRAPDQGLTWGALESAGNTWDQIEKKYFTWQQFDLLPGGGLTWSQTDSDATSWASIDKMQYTWLQWEHQPARGLMWNSMDAHFLSWNELDDCSLSWDTLERLSPDDQTHRACVISIPLYKRMITVRVRAYDGQAYSQYPVSSARVIHPRSLAKYKPPCLHLPPKLYEDASARIVWGELYAASGYVVERRLGRGAYRVIYDGPGVPAPTPPDCNEWKRLWNTPDCKRHFAFDDHIPLYEYITAQYRIRGYNSTDSSQYLELPAAEIVPVLYREDSVQLAVTAGVKYTVQLNVQAAESFGGVVMTLAYDSEKLNIDGFGIEAPTPTTDTDSGTDKPNAEIVSQMPGKIHLRCIKPMESGRAWGGLLLTVRVTALHTGSTQLELS